MSTTKNETEKQKTVKIMLPLLPGSNTSQEVFVSVNFKSYIIRRGEEVEVPEFVANALTEADRAANEEIKVMNQKAFRSPESK